jgi:hypothetical protein
MRRRGHQQQGEGAGLLRRKSRQDWLQARNAHLQAVERPVKGDTEQLDEPISGEAWFRRHR